MHSYDIDQVMLQKMEELNKIAHIVFQFLFEISHLKLN